MVGTFSQAIGRATRNRRVDETRYRHRRWNFGLNSICEFPINVYSYLFNTPFNINIRKVDSVITSFDVFYTLKIILFVVLQIYNLRQIEIFTIKFEYLFYSYDLDKLYRFRCYIKINTGKKVDKKESESNIQYSIFEVRRTMKFLSTRTSNIYHRANVQYGTF